MNITSKTKVLGIFGYPVEHTISPAIHNAAIKALGLNAVYLPFEVKPQDLKEAASGIRGLHMLGVNITIPHKETAIKYLDYLSPEAKITGAVNAIVNKNGRLTGHNTDGYGYAASIREDCKFIPEGKDIVILGAGGAARGVIAALAEGKAKKIVIANRTPLRAISLVRTFKRKFPGVKFETAGIDKGSLKILLKKTDLLVNATSVGMKKGEALEIPLRALPKTAVVSDIIYNPLQTLFLRRASHLGLAVHNGLGMLIHQGARSFKLWTGIDAPIEVMRRAALKALKTGGRR